MKIFLVIISLSITVYCQTSAFNISFGEFKNASSFYINSAGFFFVTDIVTDEIYKLDTLGNIIKDIGGYGWDESSFDDPVDVFVTPLNVYVCDKNNHRIQRFDKDLNFISALSTRQSESEDEQFGYPLSCVTSSQGDLFILDSENKRIIKFDLFGNFIQNFGGYDAGKYMLSKPRKIAASSDNKIFVLDNRKIVLFDQFGNGIAEINTDKNFLNIIIIFNNLTMNTKESVFYTDLNSPELVFHEFEFDGENKPDEIVSSLIFNKKLYLLTPNEIIVYNYE